VEIQNPKDNHSILITRSIFAKAAVRVIYPFKVNLLTIEDGDLVYIDEEPNPPCLSARSRTALLEPYGEMMLWNYHEHPVKLDAGFKY
jgi:hypothetical protein